MRSHDVVERVAELIAAGGYPGQSPYLENYARVFLQSYFDDDQLTADSLNGMLSVLPAFTDGEFQRMANIVCERWQHWHDLLKVTLPTGRLRVEEPHPGYQAWK